MYTVRQRIEPKLQSPKFANYVQARALSAKNGNFVEVAYRHPMALKAPNLSEKEAIAVAKDGLALVKGKLQFPHALTTGSCLLPIKRRLKGEGTWRQFVKEHFGESHQKVDAVVAVAELSKFPNFGFLTNLGWSLFCVHQKLVRIIMNELDAAGLATDFRRKL